MQCVQELGGGHTKSQTKREQASGKGNQRPEGERTAPQQAFGSERQRVGRPAVRGRSEQSRLVLNHPGCERLLLLTPLLLALGLVRLPLVELVLPRRARAASASTFAASAASAVEHTQHHSAHLATPHALQRHAALHRARKGATRQQPAAGRGYRRRGVDSGGERTRALVCASTGLHDGGGRLLGREVSANSTPTHDTLHRARRANAASQQRREQRAAARL